MLRRTYLLLLLVRLYFAVSPSYIHPDENFQGPEVIAGEIFSFPHHKTWEFTSDHPVRSVFPLWPVYGLPMIVLRWVWTETGKEEVAPEVIYYTMRILMFILSFVLEDWAIHELVQSPRQRRLAVILVASSYVTWTYQTHMFSNSIETLVVAWSLVMIQRILDNKHRSSIVSSALLGSLLTFGTFTRITFPAFLFAPGLYLLPHFSRKLFSLLALTLTTTFTSALAIAIDTSFYASPTASNSFLHQNLSHPVITPLNSLLYNTSKSNLSLHGLHPLYTHFLVSLPLLLGPAILLLLPPRLAIPKLPLLSAITGTTLLSLIPHQEPRFLLPAIPLILSSITLPKSLTLRRSFLASWVLFNALLGILMGVYHQGGVVPAQIWLGQQQQQNGVFAAGEEVFWWRTYSPPIWLLDGNGLAEGKSLRTVDMMGSEASALKTQILNSLGNCGEGKTAALVAPWSSTEIDKWRASASAGEENELELREMWRYKRHSNLDDLDIGGEGVWGTLRRVVGRRGLVVWKVGRRCGGLGG